MTPETKGQAKITAKEVLAARKLKVANPEMTMKAIKDKLKLKIHVIMVGRAIRGITHGHLDMCGLPVRPFEHRDGTPVKKVTKTPAKKASAKKAAAPAKKAARVKKAAPAKTAVAKKAVAKKTPVAPVAAVVAEPLDGKTLSAGGTNE